MTFWKHSAREMTNFVCRRTRIGRVGFDPVEEPSGLAAIIKTEDSRIHSSLVAPAAAGTFFANILRQCKQAFKKVVHIKVLAKIAPTVKITTRISARFSQFASIFAIRYCPPSGQQFWVQFLKGTFRHPCKVPQPQHFAPASGSKGIQRTG